MVTMQKLYYGMEPTVPLRPLPLNKILSLTKKKHERRGRRGTAGVAGNCIACDARGFTGAASPILGSLHFLHIYFLCVLRRR